MTSTAASSVAAAAVAAVLHEAGNTPAIPTSSHHRRGLSSKKGAESTSVGSISLFGSYLARGAPGSGHDHATGRKHSPTSNDENATVDDAPLGKPISTKHRSRRASEGSHLIKGDGKRVIGELRCDRCGKGYKHSSCLTKHMCVYPLLPTFPPPTSDVHTRLMPGKTLAGPCLMIPRLLFSGSYFCIGLILFLVQSSLS